MIVDHLLEMDENDSDSEWRKKALKESASTAYGGKHIYDLMHSCRAEDSFLGSWH